MEKLRHVYISAWKNYVTYNADYRPCPYNKFQQANDDNWKNVCLGKAVLAWLGMHTDPAFKSRLTKACIGEMRYHRHHAVISPMVSATPTFTSGGL